MSKDDRQKFSDWKDLQSRRQKAELEYYRRTIRGLNRIVAVIGFFGRAATGGVNMPADHGKLMKIIYWYICEGCGRAVTGPSPSLRISCTNCTGEMVCHGPIRG